MKTAVYLIAESGRRFFKIGVARDPKRRLKALQTANPTELNLTLVEWFPTRERARRVERALHRNFADNMACGEWFDGDLLRAMREMASYAIFVRSGGDPSMTPFDVTVAHWALSGDHYPGQRPR